MDVAKTVLSTIGTVFRIAPPYSKVGLTYIVKMQDDWLDFC